MGVAYSAPGRAAVSLRALSIVSVEDNGLNPLTIDSIDAFYALQVFANYYQVSWQLVINRNASPIANPTLISVVFTGLPVIASGDFGSGIMRAAAQADRTAKVDIFNLTPTQNGIDFANDTPGFAYAGSNNLILSGQLMVNTSI